MRILHTVASLNPSTGGPARSVPGLAAALGEMGHEVHVWSPEIPANFPVSAGFILHRGTLDAALDDMGKPDVIHDHGVWLPINHRVAKMSQQRGIPRIVSPRGMLEPWALNHKKWKKKIAWWLYQRNDLESAEALHATADAEAAQFKQLGLHVPVHVIPNGVGLPEDGGRRTEDRGQQERCPQVGSLSPAPRPPSSAFRPPSPSPSSPKTALFLSRIHPKKGLPMLVEAWAKVRPEGWRMRVVGPDEDGHRAEVEALVRRLGLTEEWGFEDSLEDDAKWNAFASADLFILPTYSENFGISVAEALTCRVPVITTTGTPWQGLREHQCGWWIEPTLAGLSDALANATSLTNIERADMGSRGRIWMVDEFMWSCIALRMSEVYGKIVGNTSRVSV